MDLDVNLFHAFEESYLFSVTAKSFMIQRTSKNLLSNPVTEAKRSEVKERDSFMGILTDFYLFHLTELLYSEVRF